MAKGRGCSKINIYNILAWVPLVFYVIYLTAPYTYQYPFAILLIFATPVIGLVFSILAIKFKKVSRLLGTLSLIINIILTFYVIWGLSLLIVPASSPDVTFNQADLDTIIKK